MPAVTFLLIRKHVHLNSCDSLVLLDTGGEVGGITIRAVGKRELLMGVGDVLLLMGELFPLYVEGGITSRSVGERELLVGVGDSEPSSL